MKKIARVVKQADFISKFTEKAKEVGIKLGFNTDVDYSWGKDTVHTIIYEKGDSIYLVVQVIITVDEYNYIRIYDANNKLLRENKIRGDNFDFNVFVPILSFITDTLKAKPQKTETENVSQETILETAEQVYDFGEENNWQGLENKHYKILSKDKSLAQMAVADMQDKELQVPDILKKFRRYSMDLKQVVMNHKIAQSKKTKLNKKAEFVIKDIETGLLLNGKDTVEDIKDAKIYTTREEAENAVDEIMYRVINKMKEYSPSLAPVNSEDYYEVIELNAANHKKAAEEDIDVKLKVQKNKPAGLDTTSPKALPESIRPLMQNLKDQMATLKETETKLANVKADLDAKYQQAKDESKIVEKQAEIENLTNNIGKLLFAAKNETFQFQDNLVALTHQTKVVPAKATDKWKFEKVFDKLKSLMGDDNAQKFLDATLNGLQSQATEKTITELNIFSPTQKQLKTSDTSDTNKFIDALKEIYMNLRSYFLDVKKANNIIEEQLATGATASKTNKLTKKAGESYGWVVNEEDAQDKLDLWIQTVGTEKALDDLRYAMGNFELANNLAYIFRMNDFREGCSDYEEEEEDTEIESKKKVNLKKAKKVNKKAKVSKKAINVELDVEEYIDMLQDRYDKVQQWHSEASDALLEKLFDLYRDIGGEVKSPMVVIDNYCVNGEFVSREDDFTADGGYSNKFEEYNGNWEEFCQNEALIYNEDFALMQF